MPPSEIADPWAKIEALEAEVEALRGAAATRVKRPGRSARYRVRVAPPRKGRDRGCWCLRVYGPDSPGGNRELTEFPATARYRGEAEGAALVREARLNGEGLTLCEIVLQWRKAKAKEVCARTAENHRIIGDWLMGTPHMALRDPLRGPEVLALQDALWSKFKAGTARLYFGTIRSAWRWARARDLVRASWPDLPRRRTARKDRCRKRAFSEGEVRELLAFLATWQEGHYLTLGWALAETACRIGELRELRVEDVIPTPSGAGLLRVGHRIPTKTGAERQAHVSPALLAALDTSRDPLAPLFPSRRNPDRPQVARSFRDAVAKWLRRVGLEGVRDVHSLRRRGAVALHTARVPVEVAKRVTGHESSAVFLSYAERGEYALEEERRLLWVEPPQASPGKDSKPGEEAGAA